MDRKPEHSLAWRGYSAEEMKMMAPRPLKASTLGSVLSTQLTDFPSLSLLVSSVLVFSHFKDGKVAKMPRDVGQAENRK